MKSVYIYLFAVAAVVELFAGIVAAAGEILVANLINSVNSETVTEDDSE